MPGWIFAGFWDFVHDVFMDVVTVHLHSLTLFFAPFGCGGLCAAHGIPCVVSVVGFDPAEE